MLRLCRSGSRSLSRKGNALRVAHLIILFDSWRESTTTITKLCRSQNPLKGMTTKFYEQFLDALCIVFLLALNRTLTHLTAAVLDLDADKANMALRAPPSQWHTLPPELLQQIFGNLEASDLLRAELCCRTWYKFLSTSKVGKGYAHALAALELCLGGQVPCS